MADRVPYTGAPESAQSPGVRFEATPEMHVEAPPAAFGATVAQAVQGLGEVQEGAGKELFARAQAFQDLTNHATARGAAVQTAMEQAKLWSDFDSKGGMDAGPEALSKLQQDLEGVRQRNGQGLNPDANELYQNDAASLQNRFYLMSASHAATAVRQYNLETIDAQRKTANNIVEGAAHTEPKMVDQAYAHNQSAVILEGHQKGYAPDSDIAKAKLTEYNSETTFKAVKGFIDRKDPEGAKAFLEKQREKGRIAGEWDDRAQALLDRGMQKTGAEKAADSPAVAAGKTIEEKVKAAGDEADKISGGDPEVRAHAEQIAANRVTLEDKIKKDNLARANNTIEKALSGMVGTAPKSRAELMADPEFKSAYDTLSNDPESGGKFDLAFGRRYDQVLRSDNNLTPERSLVTQRLIGMAHEQPNDFITLDLSKVNITENQRRELLQIQQDISKNGTAGFRDKAADNTVVGLKQDLKDAGIEHGSTEYNEYRGALQMELDNMRISGKTVTTEEARKIAKTLLQSKVIEKGYIFNTKGFGYQPSAEEAAAIRSQLGPNLTDDQVQKVYLKKLYDKLHENDARPKSTNKIEAPANGQ
jgi:hypothetical protein